MSTAGAKTLDRRTFIGAAGVTLTLGALPVLAVLHAGPSLVPRNQIEPLGDWTGDWAIDDMWNHLPRPTVRIGLGRRPARCTVDVAVVDRQACG